MRAKLIHNESLYSSAEAVFGEVKDNLGKYENHIIIVPERYTLISEKQLLNALGKKCAFECEVISINRLCNRVFGIGEVLDKQGGVMLVQKILQEKSKELVFFKSMHSKLGFAENLYQTIMQLKSSGIGVAQVGGGIETTLFSLKMQDIKLVYEEYEKYIALGYTDGAFKLEKLRSEIKTNKFFKNTAFYFAYFESLTFHENKIISDLISNDNFCVVGCRYCLGAGNDHIFTNSVYHQVESIFFEKGLTEIVEHKHILPSVFEGIKHNLFAYSPKKQLNYLNKVRLFKAKSQTEEVRNVLKQIYFLIHEKGYRFKDINIAVSNIEKYRPIFEKELRNFDFSVFFDSAISLVETELGRFISTMLECVHYGFMHSDIFVLINNEYFGLSQSERDLVNLFLKRYAIQGISHFVNFEFINKDELFCGIAKEIDVEIQETLKKTFDKLEKIKELLSGVKSAISYVNSINEILTYFNIELVTNELIEKQKEDLLAVKSNEQVIGKLNKLLNQIVELEISNEYSNLGFSQILLEGLNASKINLVPLSVDSIYIGDASDSTFEKKKAMFILGTTYGELPRVKDDVGLILDREIDALSSRFILEPKVSELNMRSRLKAFELCLLPTDILYCYYPEGNDSGESLKPSPLFQSLSKCFYYDNDNPLFVNSCEFNLNLVEKEDKEGFLESLGSLKMAETQVLENLEQISDIRFQTLYSLVKEKTNLGERIAKLNEGYNKPLIKDLSSFCFKSGKNGGRQTSFTQLSEYFSCPFKHFVKRGLKIEELKKVGINQLEIGNILHAYAQYFVNALKENKKPFSEKELDIEIDKTKEKIKEEFSQVFDLDENKLVLKGVVKEGEKLIRELNFRFSQTNFLPFKTEMYFSDYVVYEGEEKYYLSGSIDRVDCFNHYYSIIDYKTGDATLKIKDIYYGLKLQLPLYSSVLSKKIKDSIVVGFGYYPIKDKFVNISKNQENSFKIDGFYWSDEYVLENLDTNLKDVAEGEKVKSKAYAFGKSILKKGTTKLDGCVIGQEDFNLLVEYANQVISKAIEEIEMGYIEPKPVKDFPKSSCDYCEYSSICNRELFAKERETNAITIENIKEALSGISTNGETEESSRCEE